MKYGSLSIKMKLSRFLKQKNCLLSVVTRPCHPVSSALAVCVLFSLSDCLPPLWWYCASSIMCVLNYSHTGSLSCNYSRSRASELQTVRFTVRYVCVHAPKGLLYICVPLQAPHSSCLPGCTLTLAPESSSFPIVSWQLR